jgi:hypothetical protein
MKTVYDRLIEEAKAKLLEQSSNYPNSIADIIHELRSHNYYFTVKYGTAIRFKDFTGMNLNEAVEPLVNN